MNRQIIFRGKRLDNGEWVYGLLVKMWGEWHIIDWDDENSAYPVNPDTIGQYINYEAANEKKIFVADYIRVNYKHEEYTLNGAIPDQDCFCLGEVVYMENALCYGVRIFKAESFLADELEYNEQLIMPLYYFDLGDDIEVVGNRFDNPELLED